jgi:hypothetical protein
MGFIDVDQGNWADSMKRLFFRLTRQKSLLKMSN